MTGTDTVRLGRIVGLFGVRGWVKVFSYTEPREAILDYANWLIGNDSEWSARAVAEGKRHGKSVVARLEGVEDRDTAAGLLGRDIAVSRNDLPEPGGNEYYWADLVGMEVLHRDERLLGRVTGMLETGAHDVMCVNGDGERLIPFVMGEVVLDVDVDAGKISVDWEWD